MYSFNYQKVKTVADAAKVLAKDSDAKLLAGGQSLIAAMKLRLAHPSEVIDLGELPGTQAGGLHEVQEPGFTLRHRRCVRRRLRHGRARRGDGSWSQRIPRGGDGKSARGEVRPRIGGEHRGAGERPQLGSARKGRLSGAPYHRDGQARGRGRDEIEHPGVPGSRGPHAVLAAA